MHEPPAEGPIAAPVAEASRIRSLDILRGVAVLGIFVMNSRNFALPLQQFDNPAFPEKVGTNPQAADLWAWALGNVFFEDKMIAIFSMLFGAGIVLHADRLGHALRAAAIHYRRMFWLLVIGLIHAFGLWYGDILNTYAICGMALYPIRRLRAPVLVGLGILVLTVTVWIRVGPRMLATIDPPANATATQTPTPNANAAPSAPSVEPVRDRIWSEATRNEEAAYKGSYLDLFRWRAKLNILWHGYAGIDFSFWRSGGYMLIGMGLVSVFNSSRSSSVYWGLLVGGYAAGLTMTALGFWPQLGRALGRVPQASPEARQMLGSVAWSLRFLGAACVAMGHVGLIMLLCRASALRLVLAPLAAVGRMALTNYLMHTVIAVIIFDGWALGNWGTWGIARVETMVLAVWVAQLIVSPLWLHFFRFGPVEWLWRTLTYMKPQPFVRATS